MPNYTLLSAPIVATTVYLALDFAANLVVVRQKAAR